LIFLSGPNGRASHEASEHSNTRSGEARGSRECGKPLLGLTHRSHENTGVSSDLRAYRDDSHQSSSCSANLFKAASSTGLTPSAINAMIRLPFDRFAISKNVT
jgi:hypothetical protein